MPISGNAARAYVYLVSRGFSPYAAAGMVGNLIGESGRNLDVGAHGDKTLPGGSHGIGQWNGPRLPAMRAWKDPAAKDELERQLSYLVHELSTKEARAGKLLRNAQDINAATSGGIAFERPRGFTWANPSGGHNYYGRLANAQQVYRDQTGENPTVGTAVAGSDGGGGGGGGGSVPIQAPPPPPDYATMNFNSGMDILMGGTGAPVEQASAQAPPPPAPAPEPAPAPAQPPALEPTQGSAATLMASLLDRKRMERSGLPPGLLDTGYA